MELFRLSYLCVFEKSCLKFQLSSHTIELGPERLHQSQGLTGGFFLYSSVFYSGCRSWKQTGQTDPVFFRLHFTTVSSSFSFLSIFLFILFFTFSPSHGVRTCYGCWPPWYIHNTLVCLCPCLSVYDRKKRNVGGPGERERERAWKMLLCSVGIRFQLCPSSSSILVRTKIWLVRESSTITTLLMYSSNLNINIHKAFVTFKFLLDVLLSILFQISKSNYAFQWITADSWLPITFRLYNSKLIWLQHMRFCNHGYLRLRTEFWSRIWQWLHRVLADLVPVTASQPVPPGTGWPTMVQKAAVATYRCSQTMQEPKAVRQGFSN